MGRSRPRMPRMAVEGDGEIVAVDGDNGRIAPEWRAFPGAQSVMLTSMGDGREGLGTLGRVDFDAAP